MAAGTQPGQRKILFIVAVVASILSSASSAIAGAPAECCVVEAEFDQSQIVEATSASCFAKIGSVRIINGDIFDLDDPAENKLLYRFANKIHATTRISVIEQQLLFSQGDQFSIRKLQESERILRSNRFIYDAKIESSLNDNGSVDISVHTSDVWTLVPKLSISRSGGATKSGIGIKETNLLGTGIRVEALYKSDVDRDSAIVKLVDRNLGNSWYRLSTLYANKSDGSTYSLGLEKPFYALDSNSAQGISFFNSEQIDSLYDRGDIVAEYRNAARFYEIYKGWSAGLKDAWSRRYLTGVVFDERRFSAVVDSALPGSVRPENRKLVYPFVGIELVQDKFEKTANQNQINRTEDRYLGFRLAARIGAARTAFGSDRNAWLVDINAQKGFGHTQTQSLRLAGKAAARIEDSGSRNLVVDIRAKYYRRQSDKRLFYASLSGTFGRNLDVDNPLLLGGDNGLRGYPLRYQTGPRRALLTLEQRFFSDWYPFRLFNVGGAVFFDAGRAWGNSPVSTRDNELLKDVGVGLRIGNSRSGQGRVTHIDLAFPLDGNQDIESLQFLIETKKSF